MKKRILFALLILLCAVMGIGAFFMLRKGVKAQEEEANKAEIIGLKDIVIQEGESLPESLSEVEVRNVEKVTVDASAVKTNQAGTYPIIYQYTDNDGKKHEKTVFCTVEAKSDEETPETEETKTPETKEPGAADTEGQETPGAEPDVPQQIVQTEPIKTGDEHYLMLYSWLAGASLAVIYRGLKERKVLQRI